MQTNFIKHLFTAVLLLGCSVVFAQEFMVNTIEYKVIDKNKKLVEVTGCDREISYENLVIPRNVTRNGVKYTVTCVGESAFYQTPIDKLTLPSSVTRIRDGAFCKSGISSFTIPSSVTHIGGGAFYQNRIQTLTIPATVKSIGEGAFSGPETLTRIKVDANNPFYDSRNNCNAIIEKRTNRLISGCKSTIIPNGVTRIGDSAFCWSGLSRVTIPSTVTSIGQEAFRGCDFSSIVVPNSVKNIGWRAFGDCSNLKSITLPRHITNVDELDLPEGCRIIWR
jgi:hypothetical protein